MTAMRVRLLGCGPTLGMAIRLLPIGVAHRLVMEAVRHLTTSIAAKAMPDAMRTLPLALKTGGPDLGAALCALPIEGHRDLPNPGLRHVKGARMVAGMTVYRKFEVIRPLAGIGVCAAMSTNGTVQDGRQGGRAISSSCGREACQMIWATVSRCIVLRMEGRLC